MNHKQCTSNSYQIRASTITNHMEQRSLFALQRENLGGGSDGPGTRGRFALSYVESDSDFTSK